MIPWEQALITSVIDTGDLPAAKKAGITADHYFLPETRSAWNWLCTYFQQHGQVPSREIFADSIRGFKFFPVPDPVPALAAKLHEQWVYNKGSVYIETFREKVLLDPLLAAKFAADEGAKFRAMFEQTTVTSTAVDITQCTQQEIASYYMRRDLHGMLGLPFPWDWLNKSTHGMTDGSFTMWYARPGNMKTWIMIYVCMWVHYRCGRTPMIFTREMPREDIQRRWCALFAKVDYDRYMEGKLTAAEEHRWLEAMQAFSECPPAIIDDGVKGTGADAAETIMDRAAAQGSVGLVAVDGIHLYGARDWDLIQGFTTAYKNRLIAARLPGVGTSQGGKSFGMGRKAKHSGDDVAYGDSMLQDVDNLIKMALIKEDNRLYMSTAKVREGLSRVFSIHAKPAYDFTQAYADEGSDDAALARFDDHDNDQGDSRVFGE